MAMVKITIGLLILKIFVHVGLQFVWNLLNILIFLIFMQMWLISLPVKARIFLQELKNLALLEFIPYEDLFGFLEEDSSPYETQFGIERLGSNHLASSMFLIGLVLAALLVILLLTWILAKRFLRCKKAFELLKKKLIYNAIIRFILQSSVELQVAACTVISYDRHASKPLKEPTDKD